MKYTLVDLKKDDYFKRVSREMSRGFTGYVNKLNQYTTNARSLERRKVRSGGRVHKQLIDADIYVLYNYAIDYKDYSNFMMEIQDIIQKVLMLVWHRPILGSCYDIDMDSWRESSAVGFLIHFVQTKLSFEGGADMSIDNISILSGLSVNEVIEKIKEEELVDDVTSIEIDDEVIENKKAQLLVEKYKVC